MITHGQLLQLIISYAVPCAIKTVTICIPHAVYSVYISDSFQCFTVGLVPSLVLEFHRHSCAFFPLGDRERM